MKMTSNHQPRASNIAPNGYGQPVLLGQQIFSGEFFRRPYLWEPVWLETTCWRLCNDNLLAKYDSKPERFTSTLNRKM